MMSQRQTPSARDDDDAGADSAVTLARDDDGWFARMDVRASETRLAGALSVADALITASTCLGFAVPRSPGDDSARPRHQGGRCRGKHCRGSTAVEALLWRATARFA